MNITTEEFFKEQYVGASGTIAFALSMIPKPESSNNYIANEDSHMEEQDENPSGEAVVF